MHDPSTTASATIRSYRPADFVALVGLIGQPFGGETTDSVRFAVSAHNTTTFVAECDGQVVGVAMAISFGRTAWIGNVVVAPDFRRRGLGMALTRAACAAAQEQAETVLLLALGDARRIYERVGFVDDGLYGTWTATPATPASVRAVETVSGVFLEKVAAKPQTIAMCLALDGQATGEDRRAYLEHFVPTMMAACRRSPKDSAREVVGYNARLAWGTGAVIANDPDVARLLVCDLLTRAPETHFEFPDANEAGARLTAELGLVRAKENMRMRLGPPVAGYRPQAIFKALTPAVG
jgi:predicted N-acetyltransferase YhbS